MRLTHTFTRTHNAVRFANPYQRCRRCGGWVDGFLDCTGPTIVIPCEHVSDYQDMCPSWGPVDGCTCAEWNTTHPGKTPIPPHWRIPETGDTRIY